MLIPAIGRVDPDSGYAIVADGDESGHVDGGDFQRFLAQFLGSRRPGPSGLACAGRPPCAAPLPAPSQAEHVLGRISYGATPETRARFAQLGADAYVREQLAPDRIADPALEARLASLPSLVTGARSL